MDQQQQHYQQQHYNNTDQLQNNDLQQPLIDSTSNEQHQHFDVDQNDLIKMTRQTFGEISGAERQQNSLKINEIGSGICEGMADAEPWLMSSSEAQELFQKVLWTQYWIVWIFFVNERIISPFVQKFEKNFSFFIGQSLGR